MTTDRGLQCSVNLIGCKGKVKYVCHHCGCLLCDGPNCCKWGWDSDFAGWSIAYHCPVHDHLSSPAKFARFMINISNQIYDYLLNAINRLREIIVTIIRKIWAFIRRVFNKLKRKKEQTESTN